MCLMLSPSILLATHNRAGEITFKSIGDPEDLLYEIYITTYTASDRLSAEAHRKEIQVFFGHGSPEVSEIVKATIQKETHPSTPGVWRNQYQVRHRFPGPSQCYIISFIDPNRVSAILNINDSNSVDIPFYIQTELCIYDATGKTLNNSPVLLERPVSYACIGQRYEHNPNAFDIDGDSLSYELVAPMMGKNNSVSNYTSPEQIKGNEGGSFEMDVATGELVWENPMRPGLYNIAFRIYEHRKVVTIGGGEVIRTMGYVTRDMQIIVVKCNNKPPVVAKIRDTCVVAGSGTPLTFPVTATDPNTNDPIHLTASGGPFELENSPAREWPKFLIGNSPVSGNFYWDIDCSHIRQQPYSVVFNATDDGNGFTGQELTDLELVNIKVIGPKPKNLSAKPGGRTIYLDWQAPSCEGVVSYIIYRKVNGSGWNPNACEIGVPKYTGFEQLAIVKPDQLSFADDRDGDGLFHGANYCYRVTALYKIDGQFAQSEGIASNEVCAELRQDVPIIIQSTVESTGISTGETKVKWGPPIELDTLVNVPPYRFLLHESGDLKGKDNNPILTNSYASYSELTKDSVNRSFNLNTLSNAHSYRIEFHATDAVSGDEVLIGTAKSASTPWLKIKPDDKKLLLSVEADVPWKNDSFAFYKRKRRTNNWIFLGYSSTGKYVDSGLTNGVEYCYKAQTFGAFDTYPEYTPIVNWSQEGCGVPKDMTPPCPPILRAQADCDRFSNKLQWTFENLTCSYDVVKYHIFYQELGKGPFVLVDSIDGSNVLNNFDDQRVVLVNSLAGCYKIIAIDSFYNKSDSSNAVCVDNCPIYVLPNIITPNGDDFNDFFVPLKNYRFIESVSITVFNRWGQDVHTSNEIAINWDGTDQRTGNPLSSGTYYYVCEVTYIRLKENEKRTFSGTVTIAR